jgi:hypothetical protein
MLPTLAHHLNFLNDVAPYTQLNVVKCRPPKKCRTFPQIKKLSTNQHLKMTCKHLLAYEKHMVL